VLFFCSVSDTTPDYYKVYKTALVNSVIHNTLTSIVDRNPHRQIVNRSGTVQAAAAYYSIHRHRHRSINVPTAGVQAHNAWRRPAIGTAPTQKL
jgi:hypothetical protein